jgi:N4-gp56 family major capsid protein
MEVNPIVDEIIGYNAGLSVDTLARNRLESASGGTNGGVLNVVYSDAGSPAISGTEAARNRLAIGDQISAQLINYPTAKMRGQNVMAYGNVFKGVIHPDVSYDLRLAAPGNQWSDPHIYVDPSGVYNGVIGTFGGVQWMESPRASLFADAGNGLGAGGTIDAYGTYVFGKQAFGKMFSTGDAYGEDPVFVSRGRIDYLQRIDSQGWKHMVGYLVVRTACVYRIETASSIGTN